MAITTYSELKDAIANWTARGDLATGGANVNRVDEIIDNAEAMLSRDLRTLDMETKSASFSITGEYVAVPTNFLEVRTFYLNTSPRVPLEYLPDDEQALMYSTSSGPPRFFSVVGSNFRFAPVPDATYSATLVYYLKVPSLSGTTTTNWLLTAHPDLYLAACMIWAATFLQDAAMVQQWRAAYGDLLGGLRRSDNRSRWGGSGMAVRTA